MRYVALDIGERRVGIATGDTRVGIAFPQRALDFGSRGVDPEVLAEVVQTHEADVLLVGLPLNADGGETPQCEPIRRIAERLAQLTRLEVVFRNEALTTAKAEGMMIEAGASRKRRASSGDSVAAVVLLQELLDELGCAK
ncbi:MAG: hypothetical protein AMXMBFR61_27580 [Fimbriimonadales bacterium]